MKLLSKSDMATRWGISRQVVNNWESRHSDFPPVEIKVDNDRMPLYSLSEIRKYEQKRGIEMTAEDMDEVVKVSREESFGRAFAVLDIISARTFRNGGRGIEIQLSHELWKQPMTVLFRAHKHVMKYAENFEEAELVLLDRFNSYISDMDVEDYNDVPLDPTYLIFISKESVKLRELIKNKELY